MSLGFFFFPYLFLAKAAILKDTMAKLNEAENTLSEMEATASQQLQILASQSETAMDAAHIKIKQLQSRVRDLESFIQVNISVQRYFK